jgi:hypothetical protein
MSCDLFATHMALRNRALSLIVATTGSVSLSATATGYHRASGSFVTDQFLTGMEFVPAGFASNTPRVIKSVTDSDITTTTAVTVEAEAAARSLTVGIPSLRAYENVEFTPVTGRPYFEEDFVPATTTLMGTRDGGYVYEDGLYIAKWYGLPKFGVAALRRSVDALKLLFAPGSAFTVGTNVVRVRTDISSQTGQIIPLTNGWVALTLTIPWRAESMNTFAPWVSGLAQYDTGQYA